MNRTLVLLIFGATAFVVPGAARPADTDGRFQSQQGQSIERQIQRLDDQIHAEDTAGQISAREADAYVRELRDIETQLLEVRSRTFAGNENAGPSQSRPNTWNGDGRSDPYQRHDDPNENTPDDTRDSNGGTAY